MAMKVATFNNCRVYNLSQGKTLPEWLSDSKKRALLKDDEYRKRLELIQDFEMATASQCINMTKDKEHIIVTGTYPPIVKCFTVSDMAMKFQRGLTCEVVAFETLSDDFGKLVFLQADRTVTFHAPYGTHYSLRVPKFGRDLVYSYENCDLFVASSGEEVYRINLESGEFKEPLQLGFTGCNKLAASSTYQLLACGGEEAACEFFDTRTAKAISRLHVDVDSSSSSSSSSHVQVTALTFDTDGLTLGVGTSNGQCLLYDIRSSKPVLTKEHQYGLPVIDVSFHNSSRHVISTDKKIVKIWERDEPTPGKVLTNIEATSDINSVHVVSDRRGQSGMIMLAGEQSRVMTYFVPQLGPAPRWASFLEALTEELEETTSQTVYEDYKFITRAEVDEIGATSLLGTPMLKGYMHGFFIEMKLYSKLRAISKPFEYEEHRKKRILEKIEAKRQSRILPQKRLPKVNKLLAEKLMAQNKSSSASASASASSSSSGSGTSAAAAGIDARFAALFTREEFEQDHESFDFKLRNPTLSDVTKRRLQGGGGGDDSDDELGGRFDLVDGGSRGGNGDDDDDDDDDDDEDEDDEDGRGAGGGWQDQDEEDDDIAVRAEPRPRPRTSSNKGNKRPFSSRQDGDEEDEEEGAIFRASKKASSRGTRPFSSGAGAGPRLYEVADSYTKQEGSLWGQQSGEAKQQRKKLQAISSVPLARRLEVEDELKAKSSSSGTVTKTLKTASGTVREMSWVPKEQPKGRGRGSGPGQGQGQGQGRAGGGREDSRADQERVASFSSGFNAVGDGVQRGGGRGRGGGGGGGGRGGGRGRSSSGRGRGRGGGGRGGRR